MLPAEWRGVARLLAVRLDNIGDLVMLGPALRTLQHALPRASISLLCSPHGSQVAPLLPWVDDVIVHRASWQELAPASQGTQSARGAAASSVPGTRSNGTVPADAGRVHRQETPQDARARELALVERLAEGNFDAAVIFTSFTQSPWPPAYACYLAGIPLRLGQSREFGGQLLTQWVRPPADGGHQADRNLHLLEAAGFRPAGRHLELLLPDPLRAAAEGLLRTAGIDPRAPYLVLAPGASCATRRYPAARYAEVLRLLRRSCPHPVVLLGSPNEEGLCAALQAQAGIGGLVSLAGRSGVPEMAAVIARAALVIANNSGPLHIADAFGRPMVILYSGSELESQWAPRSAPARLLRRPTACSPCHGFSCPHDMDCLDIAPAAVTAAALALLASGHEALHGSHPPASTEPVAGRVTASPSEALTKPGKENVIDASP